MNKTKLIKIIKNTAELDTHKARFVADSILHAIKTDLRNGESIRFLGILSMTPVIRKRRWVKDIRTKKSIFIPQRKVYRLNLNKDVQKSLNKKG